MLHFEPQHRDQPFVHGLGQADLVLRCKEVAHVGLEGMEAH